MPRHAAAMLGALSLSLLAGLPYVGGTIVFGALLIGLGALPLPVRMRAAAG